MTFKRGDRVIMPSGRLGTIIQTGEHWRRSEAWVRPDYEPQYMIIFDWCELKHAEVSPLPTMPWEPLPGLTNSR